MGWFARAGGVASALDRSERIAQNVKLLFCAGKFVGGDPVVFLRARRAVPSAGAGEWDWSCWMRRLINGAWKARA